MDDSATDSKAYASFETHAYPALALDPPPGGSLTHRLDRLVAGTTSRLSPILIKEARQSIKSRQFLITFFVLLTASLLWMAMAVLTSVPSIWYLPSGQWLFAGFYWLLAVPVFGLVPLAAFRSLAAELTDDTFELLSITELDAGQIVRGKFAAACLQMSLYAAAVTPSLAFSYLLGGIAIGDVALVLVMVALAGVTLTAAGLAMAPVFRGTMGQSFLMLALVATIFIAQSSVATMVFAGVINEQITADPQTWWVTAGSAVCLGVVSMLLLSAAAAGIAPVTENRSTAVRVWMLALQSAWIAGTVGIAIMVDDYEPINFAMMVLCGFWVLGAAFLMSERRELSPRIRRGIPDSRFGSAFLMPLYPGPTSAYVFCVASALAAVLVLGVGGSILSAGNMPETVPVAAAAMYGGLILVHVGVLHIAAIAFPRYVTRGRRLHPVAMLGVALASVIAMVMFSIGGTIVTLGYLDDDFNFFAAFEFFWATSCVFDYRGINESLVWGPAALGTAVALLNLAMAGDLFKYRKVLTPPAVTREEGSDTRQPTDAPSEPDRPLDGLAG